jgi:hypothetical protein
VAGPVAASVSTMRGTRRARWGWPSYMRARMVSVRAWTALGRHACYPVCSRPGPSRLKKELELSSFRRIHQDYRAGDASDPESCAPGTRVGRVGSHWLALSIPAELHGFLTLSHWLVCKGAVMH